MSTPRMSQNAESARIAALQAEFNEKKWVWVPDERDGYLAGWVAKEEDEIGEVVMAAGGDIRRLPLYALSKMNPPKFDRVEDIADLTFLNEASVVHNLRLRYGSGAIYTYSGLFLVAINPYQSLPLYSDSIIQQYRSRRRDENPPHIFAIAERAWVNMGEERENQSILITGESGAGKTESTKKVIQYLAAIAADAHSHTPTPSHSHTQSLSSSSSFGAIMPSTGLPGRTSILRHKPHQSMSVTNTSTQTSPKGRLGLLERQILQANPILEAFGNAQTQRNNNSSRFGKFVRISFAPDGSIAGANIDWYLLEKSRVIVRAAAERSFHVFYQLLEGGSALKETLLLEGNASDYECLNKSRREVDGIDDLEEWSLLKASLSVAGGFQNALEVVGFSAAEQFDLFRIVAAVLHLGNITIAATRADDALMPDPSQAERACHILGIPVAEFTRAVLRPRVLAGREWVTQARTKQQALDELGALSKTLYEKSFGALVDRINRALDRPTSKSTFIGVLDIAGFEIFEVNAYEQLLINYTNEKLQQFFNHHMFVLEQEEYAREGIEWDYVNFGLDLQPTIDLIEGSGSVIGVLSLLDEECIMPRATDLTFTNKLHQLWSGDVQGEEPHPGRDKYEPSRFDQGFLVHHYAGKVEYHTDGWLEKNKDPLNDNLLRVLAASSEPYVASLFSEYADAPSTFPFSTSASNALTIGKKRTLKKGAFRTVGQRHKEQLQSLMAQLYATQPHFVRCIVPNANKKPGRVDVPLVLDQLRCNGVLEGIRIARLGYPNRLPFIEFRQRYEILTPGIIPRGYMDGRKASLRMVDALDLDKSLFRIGTSKIFFKAGVLAELEERRDATLYDIFSRLQARARMFSARRQMKKILNRAVAIRTIQKNARIYTELREWPWWQLYTKVRPLLAATRNDAELHKKEAELLLIKERAERDAKEKEALENLKMSLEAEKRKAEDALAAERNLAVDKDALLERSKRRELELEEEVAALQGDLDTLDSQLDRALKMQKESEDKHEALRQAFDQAAEHLVHLEGEQQDWASREEELLKRLASTDRDQEELRHERGDLEKEAAELRRQLAQREEDLSRVKERMDVAITELDVKLSSEVQAHELAKNRTDTLEHDVRQARTQLTELTRTASDYSDMIKQKDANITQLTTELEASKSERSRLSKEILEYRGRIDALTAEIVSQQDKTKTSEESRRNEVEKQKDAELRDLRLQASQLQQELSEARRTAIEVENKLKVDLESSLREHTSLLQSHRSLSDRLQVNDQKLKQTEVSLAEASKTKRSQESELQELRSRRIDLDGQLAELQKVKETKYQDFEDATLQLEREKNAQDRQVDALKQQLNAETAKYAQLEKVASRQKAELIQLRDNNAKFDREINKLLTDLKNSEWEVKQLESRQDKTIVEHVHVLEEAKRVTDRQLADAQKELEGQATYIRSLEKAKARLTLEAEDLARATAKEHTELRSKEKGARAQEALAKKAVLEAELERKNRQVSEANVRRLQEDLQATQDQVAEVTQQFLSMQRSKDELEAELARLADEADGSESLAKIQRQYQVRITQLETQLEEAQVTSNTVARIQDHIDRQHAEIRRMILSDGPQGVQFRDAILRELQSAEQASQELSPQNRGKSGVRTLANVQPAKRTSLVTNGAVRPRSESGSARGEVEDSRRQIQELSQIKTQLQRELADVKDRLQAEIGAKNEEANQRRQVLARLSELQVSSISSSAAQSELREAVEAFRVKADTYRAKLEAAEIEKVKVSRAEAQSRQSMADASKAQKALVVERDAAVNQLQFAEAKIRELETRLEEESRESSDMGVLRQRISVAMDDERKQYQKDLAERDFTADQTRKKYQELQSQRESISKLREELRKARSDHDELSLRYDDEVYNGAGWKKERERLETKIGDVSKAYDSSVAAQAEQQSQIVALHSQVRELRSVLNDAEADRALLQKARRGLQAELETIKMDAVDPTRMNSDRELQTLHLKNQDLERALEERADRVEMAYERMKKAELHAQDCQIELGKVRVENSELDKLNANLEKQIKELNLRIVDLETKSYSRNPRSSSAATIRRLESQVEELTNQLGQVTKEHRRASLSNDRDSKLHHETERQKAKLEEEIRLYEEKVKAMRKQMDVMQMDENDLQLEKRRAEREVTELRQKSLNLERQVERLRARMERPSSLLDRGSPSNSPRKT
ncbi:myosin II heavy chain [Lactarius psammicola]|nr:myosin II heavy chain [Lactarius psammicola]